MFKVTLDSGKVVILRQLDIRTQRLAIEAAAGNAKGSQALLGMYTQEEVLKSILVEIDGKKLDARQKENLDNLFDMPEYSQVLQAMEEIVGKVKKPKIEVVLASGGE